MSRNHLTKNDVNTGKQNMKSVKFINIGRRNSLVKMRRRLGGTEDEKQKEQNNLKNIVEVLSVCGRIL